jgi:Ca2+-binding EF-hand superfamily protein
VKIVGIERVLFAGSHIENRIVRNKQLTQIYQPTMPRTQTFRYHLVQGEFVKQADINKIMERFATLDKDGTGDLTREECGLTTAAPLLPNAD